MNTSNVSNECRIEPVGQPLRCITLHLTGSMLQIFSGLPPHSIKSAVFMFISAKVTALQPNSFGILWTQLLITIYYLAIILSSHS